MEMTRPRPSDYQVEIVVEITESPIGPAIDRFHHSYNGNDVVAAAKEAKCVWGQYNGRDCSELYTNVVACNVYRNRDVI